MTNKNSQYDSQNKDFKKPGGQSDFSSAFWSSVKKYRFTSITIILILIFFLVYYAKDIFG